MKNKIASYFVFFTILVLAILAVIVSTPLRIITCLCVASFAFLKVVREYVVGTPGTLRAIMDVPFETLEDLKKNAK